MKSFHEEHLIIILEELKDLIPKEQIKMVTIDSLTLPYIQMIYGERYFKNQYIRMYGKLINLMNQFPSLIILYTSILIPKNHVPKCMTHKNISRIRLQHIGGQHKKAELIQPKRNIRHADFYITKDGLSNQGIDYYDYQTESLLK